MTKKVALVDIDGCLVQDGKLNERLVAKLKEYDEIILFTQRSKFLQVAQIPVITDTSKPDAIVITPDAVDQLSQRLQKPIKVSTSVDHYFNGPTEYYENSLKNFEISLKNTIFRDDFAPSSLDPFRAEVREEAEILRGDNDASVPIGKLYPEKKVDQYIYLTQALPTLLNTNEPISIDYFDDSIKNLQEIARHTEPLPIQPNYILIEEQNLSPLDFNKKLQLEASKPVALSEIDTSTDNPTVEQLTQYISDRKAERENSGGSEYSRFWGRLFTPNTGSATTKISAADKAIKIINGEKNVNLSAHEMAALKQGRLKNALKEAINEIEKHYENQHTPTSTGPK